MNNNDIDNLTSDEAIDYFVEGIMEEKGVNAPTEEIRQDIFEGLRNTLLEQIDRSLIAELPDDKLEELNKQISEDGKLNPEIIAKAVEEAGIDVGEVTGITMARFRDLYLNQNPNEGAEEE